MRWGRKLAVALGLLVAPAALPQSLSGGAQVGGYSPSPCTPVHTPSLASYSIANQGTATIADTTHGITINDSGTAGLRIIYKAAPATPYTHTFLISTMLPSAGSSVNSVDVGWYDGSAKADILALVLGQLGASTNLWYHQNWPTLTGTLVNVGNGYTYFQFIWVKLGDDGTNVTMALSPDGCQFGTVYTVAKASGYLGATGYSNFLVGINPNGSGTTVVGTTLLSD